MEINKLFLFSKDTDAFSSQRGYNYQTLKTLESWIFNYVNNIKEDIYCEYEEDIFQKDIINNGVKFRQIKLYSKNFSFSTEEIKKCISHFFMLHVKSDYNDFSKEFIFETNSGISQKRQENDADMLREWFENQDNLDEEKLIEYANKVKEIISSYIDEHNGNEKNKAEIEEAKSIFTCLDDDFWKDFVKMIKWEFLSVSPEQEFSDTRLRIIDLIRQMPFEFEKDEPKQILGVLLDNVFSKVNEPDGEKRKLTNDELEKLMLDIGSEEDKWYSSRLEYYKHVGEINIFRLGEFYEIIDLVNYCRRKKYLHQHKGIWNPFLIFYARSPGLHQLLRRKAIYEIVFLNNEFYEVDYENLGDRIRPDGSLNGFEEDVRYYFSDLDFFNNADELENADILMKIIFTVIENKNIEIPIDELKKWYVDNYKKISRLLLEAKEPNERCKLLELKGTILMGINRLRARDTSSFLPYYEEIIDLARQAPLYNLSQFSDRIDKYIKIEISNNPTDELGITATLEEFSAKLEPLVEERDGKIRVAQKQVKRGVTYLKTSLPFNMLKALEQFHLAKDNYQQEDTMEGFILALLNIAQLYNAIGMHFAAKYYALGAFRLSMNNQLVSRTEASFGILFHSDFKQGSWLNAIIIYSQYIRLRFESNYDPATSEMENANTRSLCFILYVMSTQSYQFSYFIQSYFSFLNNLNDQSGIQFGDDIVKPSVEIIKSQIKSESQLFNALENLVDDLPLNDIRQERSISFFALGSKWTVAFNNTYGMVAIAEEYIANIQIVLAEIALSGIDFHLLKTELQITLELGDMVRQPEQIPSNELVKWKITVVYFNDSDPAKINQHSARNMGTLMFILSNISLLKSSEFTELYLNFFKKANLDTKQQSVNLYQRIHRDIYNEEDFDTLSIGHFQNENFGIDLPVEHEAMMPKDSLSAKYNHDSAITAIKNRFNNAKKGLYITLEELKKDPAFHQFIKGLRNKGWKDWQIISNMLNFIINKKIDHFEQKSYNTQEEYFSYRQKMHEKYMDLDEKDCYLHFPLEAFQSEEFMSYFDISYLSILAIHGLQSNLETPNFKAIREFMDTRFNMANDDNQENNILSEIL
jgi:hypothetical protein